MQTRHTWSKQDKQFVGFSVAIAAMFLSMDTAYAMHIMEGYLPALHCVAWSVLCLPFLAVGFVQLKHTVNENRKALVLLAMAGAFIFVISSLKIPSVTGSCSHMTGTGLGAILFGAAQTSVLGIIVLIFQAILLAHGGLTTLGANTFSMAIAGPLVTWGLYQLGKKCKLNNKVNVFIAAALGDLLTYCVTATQLSLAYPSAEGGIMASMVKFLGVFAPTQLPLAIIEGLLTVIIIIGMESFAKPELKAIGYQVEDAAHV